MERNEEPFESSSFTDNTYFRVGELVGLNNEQYQTTRSV